MRFKPLLPLAALCFLSSATAQAGEAGYAYCPNGEQYVYLYQSPSTFNVLARLKCGEKVQVLGRESVFSTYVRVRTLDGKEGYAPQSAITTTPPGAKNQDSASAKSSGQGQSHVPASAGAPTQGAPPAPAAPTAIQPVVQYPKYAPLPPEVMHAKSVYIDNATGVASAADEMYRELAKWGRFKVATDNAQVDLILVPFINRQPTGALTGTVNNDQVAAFPVVDCRVYLFVIDAKTYVDPTPGHYDVLWADSAKCRFPKKAALATGVFAPLFLVGKSPVSHLIENLRKRIEEQEKAANPADKTVRR